MSFRRVPLAIYVGGAAAVAGSLVVTIALLLASGEPHERYVQIDHWHMLDRACSFAQILLVAFGVRELARRQLGSTRSRARAAAWLWLTQLAWFAIGPLLALAGSRDPFSIYAWLGRGVGMATLGSVLALAFAARAWQVAPLAAAGLVAIQLTSHWVPVFGGMIPLALGADLVLQQGYSLVRELVSSSCLVVVAAALAASGRESAPDAPAAVRALRIARGALLVRLVAALAIATLVVGMRAPGLAKLAVYGGPLLVIATMIAFAAAIDRAASCEPGLPRLPIALGVGITLWCAAMQIEQLTEARRAFAGQPSFTLAGPIAGALGIALIGSSISSFAASRGHADLARAARMRTLAFVVLSLGAAAVPALLGDARSVGDVVAVVLVAAALGVAALFVFTGLLAQTILQLEIAPGLPGARVVDAS